jgi:hypothetical protein
VSTAAAATARGEAARFGMVEGAVMVLEAKKTRGTGRRRGHAAGNLAAER